MKGEVSGQSVQKWPCREAQASIENNQLKSMGLAR